MPPVGVGYIVGNGTRWERMGRSLWPQLAGVHLTEATKEVMALAPDAGVRRRVPAKPVLAVKGTATARKSRPQP